MTAPKNLSHTPTADAQVTRDLLLWARRENILVGSITVGTVTLTEVQDMRLATALTPTKPAENDMEAAGRNLYKEFGGDALKQLEADEQVATDVYEDDDDD